MPPTWSPLPGKYFNTHFIPLLKRASTNEGIEMIKISKKAKRNIVNGLKKFTPIIKNLRSKGIDTSEEDSRIILNDILSYILGYDKYNELRTEHREKAGRLDYIVKLTDGPNAKKKDKVDCIIEAKAIHQELAQKYVDQTLTYCLTTNTAFFILTNVLQWRLYKMNPAVQDLQPFAELIHEVDFSKLRNFESKAEDFYMFSRASYLDGDWQQAANIRKFTNINDIYTIILSDKFTKVSTQILSNVHEVQVRKEVVCDVIQAEIGDKINLKINKALNRKINPPLETPPADSNENKQVSQSMPDVT